MKKTEDLYAVYPEHDKLKLVKDESQAIGAFLDWMLNDTDMIIADWHDEQLYPTRYSIQELLGMYFNIDLNILEKEKQQMLDDIRAQQKQP